MLDWHKFIENFFILFQLVSKSAIVFCNEVEDEKLKKGIRISKQHTRFLMRVGQPKILISSHLVHTDRHIDKRTHYNIPEF